ncbi:uncharacterized protein CMC5_022340 [Chondromyces crocatus]|uniref:PGRS family protein n=1 Tax=Chondromyces crocatus TaxID=52 RepID=A0A0K1EBP9_CHOCO|nr:uncharacterized protein CMC5_022340 [Chondromyces crocatus]
MNTNLTRCEQRERTSLPMRSADKRTLSGLPRVLVQEGARGPQEQRAEHGLGVVRRYLCAGLLSAMSVMACSSLSGLDQFEIDSGDTTGSAGGGSGEETGTPVACIPKTNEVAVDDDCGVWVSSSRGDDSNDGSSKDAPKKSLQHTALVAAKRGIARLYVCGEVFEEQIEVSSGMTIFGGLDCSAGWSWKGTAKTSVHGPPDVPAVKLLAGDRTTRLEDLEIRAPDAETSGASSIGVLAAGVTAELERCAIIVGNGADGSPGAPGAEPAMPGDPVPRAQAGAPGNGGRDACTMSGAGATTAGGAEVASMCGDDGVDPSIGGKGGDGRADTGLNGEAGVSGSFGFPGTGQPTVGVWSCAGTGNGQVGEDGVPGQPGSGGSGLGTLTVESGYVGATGSPGSTGKSGQGGGGGGGARGPSFCGGVPQGSGASGGSGGSGGCGGKPGQGGGAGGSSIALVSVEAKLSLNDCSLEAGNGGKGGVGGDSQRGGAGGPGGTPGTGVGSSANACVGGIGGTGGQGGPGGGGAGGNTFSLAYKGTPVALSEDTRRVQGTPGTGGLGGNNHDAGNSGTDGIAATEQDFR